MNRPIVTPSSRPAEKTAETGAVDHAPSIFDAHSHDYEQMLDRGLSVSGENARYFARERVRWLGRCLAQLGERPASVLDFGCGRGSSIPLFLEVLGASQVTGIDASAGLLAAARADSPLGRIRFVERDRFEPDGTVDLVFCNGVFHHVPVGQRAEEVRLLFRALRPGGLLALWENNPWNPAAHYVMRRIPFDRGAAMLSPRAARRMVRDHGFRVLRSDHLFIFPRLLKWLRPLERLVSRVPLGAQYQILCRKEAAR
jgi:SAM-dependent methyltransferase